jgi:outer membrane protein assembly factor BamB
MRLLLLLLTLVVSLTTAPLAAHNWPSFRGQSASGTADMQQLPDDWDAERNTNILWRADIPGLAHSSPIVWGDRIFVTTSVSGENAKATKGLQDVSLLSTDTSPQSWRVYCLDRATGRVLWMRVAKEGTPRSRRHVNATYANSTPVTDGRYVVAFFGSEGLYAYDFDGQLFWSKDLGVLETGWDADPSSDYGFGSSPIIHAGLVILQCDIRHGSFAAAYRVADGSEAWRVERSERSGWSTPAIVAAASPELVLNGDGFVRGLDPLTGKELWRMAEANGVKIPTPISDGGLVFIGGGSSSGSRRFYGVRTGMRGDITLAPDATSSDAIAWRNRANPHLLTPLVYDGLLYVCTDNGILSVYEAKTGEQAYRQRVGSTGAGAFGASPVAADGKVYFTSQDGDTFVLRAGKTYELVSTGRLGELVMASPAIAGGALIFRTDRSVIAVGRKTS